MSFPKNKKICLICKKGFFVFPGRIKIAKYCSNKCDGLSKRNGFDRDKYRKEYYIKNKKKIIQKSVEWGRKNKKLRKIAKDKWRAKNRELTNHLSKRRQAKKAGAVGNYSLEEWHKICERFNHKCVCCKKKKILTRDHIIPVSKGGSDYISNIQPLCLSCNSKKSSKTIDYTLNF